VTSPLEAVTRFQAAFDAQDLDRIMAAMTSDCVFDDTSPPDGVRHEGAEHVRAAWERLFRASPDGAFHTEEVLESADRVMVTWRYDWGQGHVRGVDLFTVRDGLVAEKRAYVKG
jgi:ketosteroid isomerase-like protein